MGVKTPSTLEALKKRYNEMINAAETSDGTYTTADERMSLASALYIIDDQADQRDTYLKEVTQWLQPPPSNFTGQELEAYWDHRWMAVNSLEYMQGAAEAVPLLENMLTEKPTRSWVEVHVPRALQSLRISLGKQ